jgi:hypothetical protein
MCDTAPVSEAVQVTVLGDDTAWSVTWWYPDGQTITRIGDMTVIDPRGGGAVTAIGDEGEPCVHIGRCAVAAVDPARGDGEPAVRRTLLTSPAAAPFWERGAAAAHTEPEPSTTKRGL